MLGVRPRLGGCTPWRGRSGSSRNSGNSFACRPPLIERCHIVGRMDDALNESGQRLERPLFLWQILVPVIRAADARQDVTEATLGMVRRDAGPAHQRARGAPQLVQRPPNRV